MKKGFTLVELLGTIVVLGVIGIITVTIVSNSINTSKKKAFEINAKNLLEASKEYVTKNMENNDFPKEGINATDKKISIIAQANNYDQLGYFIARIKVDKILSDVVSSSSQKSGDIVTVTIEGVLP